MEINKAEIEYLKRTRFEMGLSKKVFAEKIGVCQGSYYHIEKGRYPISDQTIRRAKNLFSVYRKAEIARLEKRIETLKSIEL